MKPSRVLPVNEPPNGRVSTRRLTVALGANQLLSWGTTFYLPAVVSGAAARDLHTTSASILGGFSWALLVTGICAPRVGRWIGQRGGRRVLASSTVIFAVGMLVLASAHGTVVWFGGWTILGAGMSLGLYDAAFATAGTLLGRSVAPVITGITLLGGLASTVGWPVGAALTGALGWRGMLLVYAAMHVGIDLPLVLWAVPSGAPVVPAAPELHADRSAVRGRLFAIFCLAGFFTLRWFLSSAIAAHILQLMTGTGLTEKEGLAAAMLIGPGQVAGRIVEWCVSGRMGIMSCAAVGALLFPLGTLLLLLPGAAPVAAFALLYGMSNGIMTINRGTLPMEVLGPACYAATLGWLALPVLLAQAAAPTASVPLFALLSGRALFAVAGAAALVASFFLVPLSRYHAARVA